MNEDELTRLFDGYRDALGTCGRAPTPRRSTPRLRWAVAAVAAAILAASVALWPTDATAKALRRMARAIRDARTMDMTFETQRPSGRWVVFNRERTRDGMWRNEAEKGRGLKATFIVRDGLSLVDYERLDHATLRPLDDGEAEPGERSALDYAMGMIDSGHVSTPRNVRVVSHGATYTVVLDRPEDRYHAEIAVDAKTDLPVSAECAVDYGPDRGGLNRFRQRYRFNDPLPDGLFALPESRPIVDLRKAQPELVAQWAVPIATVGGSHVRDVCASDDGTLWIAVSRKDAAGEGELPTAVEGYVRSMETTPSHHVQGRPFQVGGEEVAIVAFTPLQPVGASSKPVRVDFSRRREGWPTPSRSAGGLVTGGLRLTPRPVAGEVPEWFPALNMDRFTLEVPLHTWEARAEALQATGHTLEAARAYERCADAFADFVVYAGHKPLEKAAVLWDRLGQTERAVADRRRAAALETARER